MSVPENVRVIRADGTVIPVELVQTGSWEGWDEWEIATAVRYLPGDEIHCDVMPAHTALKIPKAFAEILGIIDL